MKPKELKAGNTPILIAHWVRIKTEKLHIKIDKLFK
jgi:hypothetical protein